MKIAVCDDDENELTRIKELLDTYASCNNQNFIIKCFSSSVELASTAGFEKYDIYILDIIMPVMDGISLAREIRTFDKSSPVIFLTSSPEFAVESYTVKAFNYLLKPVDKIHLYNTIDDIIETFHNEQHDTFIIKNNEQVVSTDVFSSVCDTLTAHKEFALPHRSFIVNMNYIRTIDTEKILLNNDKTIPVAQRRVSDIKKQYLEFQMEE